jgi:hypothetical protein
MADDLVWEDLNAFRMSDADAWRTIDAAPGCVVTWARRDGHAIGVWVTHAVLDGALWLTTTEGRPKTTAWLRDPRMSAVFGVPGTGSVTVVGRIALRDDPAARRRVLDAIADRLAIPAPGRTSWMEAMDSDGRLVGPVAVEKLITFDERKLVY